MLDPHRTALTFRYERWRAISSGILETAGGTFLLLIAVRGFEAGAIAKALVAGGGSFGLMLGPWLVARVETAAWPVAKAAARMAVLGAIGFVIMALVPVLPVFVVGAVRDDGGECRRRAVDDADLSGELSGAAARQTFFAHVHDPHRHGGGVQ